MAHRRVVITGMGAVSALGQGLDAHWDALAAGRTGISQIQRDIGDGSIHKYGGPAGVAPVLDTSQLEARLGPRPTNVHPLSIPKQMISAPVSHLSMLFGVQGPAFTVASACASSGHAIGEGLWMIRSGRADAAVVGSAIVGRLAKGLDAGGKAPEGLVEEVLGFVKELATGVRGARSGH